MLKSKFTFICFHRLKFLANFKNFKMSLWQIMFKFRHTKIDKQKRLISLF